MYMCMYVIMYVRMYVTNDKALYGLAPDSDPAKVCIM